MIVADAANFLLGGIPGDLHDEFVMDVEPGDLQRASVLFDEMSGSVRTIHVKLSGSVASLEGRWWGDGAAAFDSEIWQPLSHGLGVLERESATAASELARLSVQAEQAHFYKVEELNQEIQTQLYVFAGTSLIGSPELGGVVSEALGGLAARLGGELVGRIVSGIVEAISTLLRKVLDAFYDLLKWAMCPLKIASSGIYDTVKAVFGMRDGAWSTRQLNPARGSSSAIRDQLRNLVAELQRGGTKISPEAVVEVRRLSDGRIVWLETGDSESGLAHILKSHGQDFANKGVPPDEVSSTVIQALKDGKKVGVKRDGTPIYAATYGGKSWDMVVVVGSNGYIVSAYPVT